MKQRTFMTQETLILRAHLSDLFDPMMIYDLCRTGYRKTGNKFWIQFAGSKGYLSHLEISCEGIQGKDNRVFGIFNKDGSLKKKVINVYHSEKNGVRLSVGKDKARAVEDPRTFAKNDLPTAKVEADDDDYLPF